MVTLVRVLVAEVVKRKVLAGRVPGQSDRSKIERASTAAAMDGRVTLDFSGVDVLSSSYFDAAIWPLWLAGDLYPVLAKVPQTAVDDIEMVLKANGGALWCFGKSSESDARVLGALDPTLKMTLGKVVEKGELTAGDLLDVDDSIGATAWSNRLASLHQLRLVRRRKDGRRLIYVPAWKE